MTSIAYGEMDDVRHLIAVGVILHHNILHGIIFIGVHKSVVVYISWSHLRCMGMKEGMGILEGKKFVCHFCLSACVMELRWEVKGLREDLTVVTDKLKVASEENEKLKRQTEQTEKKGPERVRRAQDENRIGSLTG